MQMKGIKSVILVSLLGYPMVACETDEQGDAESSTVARELQTPCTIVKDGQTYTYNNGDSLDNLFRPHCGRVGEGGVPCFCDINAPDNINCPYCEFLIDRPNDDYVCLVDGETKSFTDADGIQRTCTCTITGYNTFTASCDPSYSTVCGASANVSSCPGLTQYFNPIAGCDCYNFCGDQYIGCCKYGGACSATCNNAKLVAGCEIDPNKQPVVAPPTNPPTPAPGICIAEKNLENCPALTAGQIRIEGCDCYSYCGPKYTSCCAYNDKTCSASCDNLADGQVLTAGCQLPVQDTSTCKTYGQACESFGECCSDRCIFGMCQKPRVITARTRLSGNRGGAAAANYKTSGRRLMEDKKYKLRGM